MLQEKDCRAVDVGIASAALFVMQDSSIAHTRENQTMLDVPNLFFLQCCELSFREAESPVFLIVGSPIRNPIWMRGQTEQVLFQSGERHPAVNRHTVVDHVKIRFLKINDTLAGGALHISVVNVPF